MSSCCSSSKCEKNRPTRHRCPVNSKEYTEVPVRTILHHLKEPWSWEGTASNYYFCDDPECDVAYFGDDDSIIYKNQLRTLIGVKEQANNALLCYCFGVSKADYKSEPSTKDFVIAQTKAGLCSCDTSNPSGRCCLKDFPKK